MFFWFLGAVVVAVWFVFRDPAFDYRLLLVGAVLPAVLDAPFGGARVLHSLTFSIALMTLLMVVTRGRKPNRKMLLGLPVGTMLHLVFTGAWTQTQVFWWPFFGFGFDDATHPVVARGWWNLPLELVGLVLCWWVVRRGELGRPDRRAWFRTTGQLSLPLH